MHRNVNFRSFSFLRRELLFSLAGLVAFFVAFIFASEIVVLLPHIQTYLTLQRTQRKYSTITQSTQYVLSRYLDDLLLRRNSYRADSHPYESYLLCATFGSSKINCCLPKECIPAIPVRSCFAIVRNSSFGMARRAFLNRRRSLSAFCMTSLV